ncbi:hypothetical protein HDV06_006362 [Boothiomyces sp. JEL0866]|nr:hypothetical protein HDV06_006362 [Boothiomyces sp. JEL0866]
MIGQIIKVQQFQKCSRLFVRTDQIQEYTFFNPVDESMVGRYCYFKTRKNVLDQLVWLYKEPSIKDTESMSNSDLDENHSDPIKDLVEQLQKTDISITTTDTPEGHAIDYTDPILDDPLLDLQIEDDIKVEFSDLTVSEYMADLKETVEDSIMDDLLLNSILSELKEESFIGESIVDETVILEPSHSTDQSHTLTATQTNKLLQQLLC